MGLIEVVVILFVIGFLLWLFNTYGAKYVDPKFKTLINVVVIIAAVLWLLAMFFPGVWRHDIPINSLGR